MGWTQPKSTEPPRNPRKGKDSCLNPQVGYKAVENWFSAHGLLVDFRHKYPPQVSLGCRDVFQEQTACNLQHSPETTPGRSCLEWGCSLLRPWQYLLLRPWPLADACCLPGVDTVKLCLMTKVSTFTETFTFAHSLASTNNSTHGRTKPISEWSLVGLAPEA